MIWMALALTAEIVVFVLAGFLWFRFQGYTCAEAGAGAIVALFMGLSLIHQVSLYLGSPLVGAILQTTALAAILGRFFLGQLWSHLSGAWRTVSGLVRQVTFPSVILLAGWSGMISLAVFARQDQPSWPQPWGGWMTTPLSGAPLAPLNMEALFHHTGQWGLAPGACGFGLLAHMAIGFSTYALARRYAWPPMALTVTLLVVSMPRLVHLGIRPTPEIIAAAAVAFSLVLLYRLVEQHRPMDLLFFLLSIFFSIQADPMSLSLVPILLLLVVVVMVRRWGWIVWTEMLAVKPWRIALALVPVLILAQVPVFALNLIHGYPVPGVFGDGGGNSLLAGGVNVMRFLLISIDVTEPVRQTLIEVAGLELNRLLTGIHTLVVTWSGVSVRGSTEFTPIFSGSGLVGFGPLIPLLVWPAMVHAFLRGPRRLKTLGVAWVGYLYLAAMMVAWHPNSLRVLTPLYAASGFVVAFSLPPHRVRRRGMRLLQALALLLLGLSLYLAV